MILNSLFTALTDSKGWGVFTNKPIPKNTIIEISPVLVMTSKEKVLLDQTKLFNYIFDWNQDQCCMAMGNVPIYNHACPSNCEYFQDYENNTIYIKTVRSIKANEELTINYQGDFDSEKPVWFEVA
jgi:uncharacterized protein